MTVGGVQVGTVPPPADGTYFSYITSRFAVDASGRVTTPPTNNALAFNGTNNFVPIVRPIQDDFTIEYWTKTTQVSLMGSQWFQGSGIVDGEVAGITNDFGTALLSGKASFGTGSPDVTIISKTKINDGNWHHIAATRTKSTGLMLLYVDGKLEASSAGTTTSASSLTAPPRLLLGGTQTGVSFFAGQLDEVRIYTTALTQTQVQADMYSTTAAVPTSLTTYYNFDQGMAGGSNTGVTSLTDQSSTSNTGTLNNFALTGTTSN